MSTTWSDRPVVRWGLCAAVAVAVGFLMPVSALAQDLQPITSVTQSIEGFLTGNFATALATIAVVAVGYGAWTGLIDKERVLAVILGIGIVFGAASIVAVLRAAAQ